MRSCDKINPRHVFPMGYPSHNPPLPDGRTFVYLTDVPVTRNRDLILSARDKFPGMRALYFQIANRVETSLASPPSAQQTAQPPMRTFGLRLRRGWPCYLFCLCFRSEPLLCLRELRLLLQDLDRSGHRWRFLSGSSLQPIRVQLDIIECDVKEERLFV